MRLIIMNNNGYKEKISVEDYVNRSLDIQDYDTGKLEDLEDSVKAQREAFARLLDVLACKGVLSSKEITKIVTGCDQPDSYMDFAS